MIQEQINNDLKEAMLNKETFKRNLLRVVIGEFNRVDKIINDEKALSIIKKMIENAKNQNHDDEVIILNKYLPQQMNKEQLEKIIKSFIILKNITTIKEIGLVMKFLKEKYSGKYDGKMASEIIKSFL